ncbi:prepilin peptidase [Mycolicibacter kumamotonensis]|jgi:leader peptidase (prepilin peptidase)/N-methyltransferase|uniref:Peptidase A24 n=1 Tax=Mycolicibacter kumamotonensis TaxID=354243 RepID=A0A1B8SAF1_9MYCO|nr:A24 family peptidase [Mycolicibacter kumamotonensis]NDJ91195.1 prepilin peptidase [Mycolicibacter kumamotonensis]OBY29729.1 peptidase A24 [Mycolicibacter kumamotonensis]ORA75817.1 prepilin peptidase [Mycolicibacter kumamotonensis]
MAAVLVVAWLALLSGYDIRQRRLPNWLTLPAVAVVPAVAAGAGRGTAALAGAAALTAVYLAVHLIAPAGLGAGDVKLAAGLGALTGSFGVDVWLLAALCAPLLTGVWGVIATLARRGPTVPHGPSMCLASAVAAGLGMF